MIVIANNSIFLISSIYYLKQDGNDFLILTELLVIRRYDSSVGIATGYRLDDRGVVVRVPVGSIIFTSYSPDQFWGPPNFLSSGYRGLFPRG
jgi:hypothetical protein